ncbi:MAG TPA: type VI secretion system membrane subunit TssM [Pyrinomonadaceae bacterium]|jgi:type VI secretion system protein ImpL
MSSLWDQIKSTLGLTGLFSVYGIAGLVVWFVGAEYGVGFLEQIVIIGLLALTAPFAFVYTYRKLKREEKREAAEAAPADDDGRADDEPAPAERHTHRELASAAAEVVERLRSEAPAYRPVSSRLGRLRRGLRVLLGGNEFKEKDPVYALPWMVVAGPEGSGKSSLVISFDMNPQPLEGLNQTHANLRELRKTDRCEWRVSDSAVLLDTEGSYQGAFVPKRKEWEALIALLKKHRDLRPLDSLILVVSAADLSRMEEQGVTDQARALGGHLRDLARSVGSEFPVYVVFTRLDDDQVFEGFREFFATLGHDERGQVWGSTIRLKDDRPPVTLFDEEFDLLLDVLKRQRLVRLGTPAAPGEQLRVFQFPARFARARRNLAHFISVLFGGPRAGQPEGRGGARPLLRGFYFTASPPTFTPDARRAGGGRGRAADGARPTVRDRYFTAALFEKVLLSDRDLTRALRSRRARPTRLRYALAAAPALLLVGFAVGAVNSFLNNRDLIKRAREVGTRVEVIRTGQERAADFAGGGPAVQAELKALDDLRGMLDRLDEYERDRPLGLSLGLYSGNAISPELRHIYFEAVTHRFYKPAVLLLESDLRAFAAGAASPNAAPARGQDAAAAEEADLERHYDLLKAYLMLSDASRAEPEFLVAKLQEYWRKSSSAEMTGVSDEQLRFFASQAARPDAPHATRDEELVKAARVKLLKYPAPDRYYKRVTSEINHKVDSVSVEALLDARGREVLGGSYGVPGSYTIEGYREHFREALKSAPEDITKEDWVMGGAAAEASRDTAADVERVRSRYFRDYADHWRKFLGGVRVRQFGSRGDAEVVLAALQQSNSPMSRVLTEVARQTHLSAAPTGNFFRRVLLLITSSGTYNDTRGNSEVEQQFRPLFEYVDGKGGPSALSEYGNNMRAVHDQLPDNEEEMRKVVNQFLAGENESGLPWAVAEAEKSLDRLKTTAAGTDAAAVLRQPLDNLRKMLNVGGFAGVQKIWREQIYPLAVKAESGYPFTAGPEDASVEGLTDFLNPVNGKFTLFYQNHLAASFDDVEGQWRPKEQKGQDAFDFSEEFVAYINRLRRLREALFPPNSREPKFAYTLTLNPVADANVRVEIDGTKAETTGTSSQSSNFYWPGQLGQTSGGKVSVIRNGEMSVVGAERPRELSYPGVWGLFKMFDAAGKSRGADGQYTLSWNTNQTNVTAKLNPGRQNNHPFERKLFTEGPRAPERLR